MSVGTPEWIEFQRMLRDPKFDGEKNFERKDEWLANAMLLGQMFRLDDTCTKGMAVLLSKGKVQEWAQKRVVSNETGLESFLSFADAANKQFAEPIKDTSDSEIKPQVKSGFKESPKNAPKVRGNKINGDGRIEVNSVGRKKGRNESGTDFNSETFGDKPAGTLTSELDEKVMLYLFIRGLPEANRSWVLLHKKDTDKLEDLVKLSDEAEQVLPELERPKYSSRTRVKSRGKHKPPRD